VSRHARRAISIVERLAASDPTHAGWQRDLVVTFYKLANVGQQTGDTEAAAAFLQRCRETLHTMKATGKYLDAPLVSLLEQLDRQ
jgi:hypothetical protein